MKPWTMLCAALLAFGCSDSSTRTETPCNEGECGPSLDLLWVIDNSQSMCQEQKIIRANFRRIIEGLDANLDFHIAVTTTHMDSSYPLEPVASPGLLQSTPQPVVGFDPTCWYAIDDQGELLDGSDDRQLDLSPVRDAIAAAVACMENPNPDAFDFTDDEIRCALPGAVTGCAIPGVCESGECNEFSIFPDPSEYRSIPKVLRARDYQGESGLDVERLTADFACMSMVGTRGARIETGLIAAVEAVSPANTGGPLNAPEGTTLDTSAPNHGFIRHGAEFALILVSDENDCSHEGARNVTEVSDPNRPQLILNGCGDQVCAFAAKPGTEATSPLIPVQTLSEQFVANLTASKARSLGPADIFVASFHGVHGPYTGEVPENCGATDEPLITPTCSSQNGSAKSGDRYEAFLRTFPVGQYYPAAQDNNPSIPLRGLICEADFGDPFTEFAQLISD